MRLILMILLLLLSAPVAADGVGEFEAALDEASRLFEAGAYEQAVMALEDIVEVHPGCAECAHFLGRAYGRLAEQSSWVKALGLAKKTRIALETAVALDPLNDLALEDLITFYRAAPGFLGGNNDKADTLERRLRTLRTGHTS